MEPVAKERVRCWGTILPLPCPTMSKLLRGLVAGYGAKKLGGGCFSTVLVFLLLWWLLGYCNAMQ
jgi:hypothetical protein